MILLHTPKEMQQFRRELKSDQTVGFVPTMGALHAGHAALMKKATAENDLSILSIFVNPKQFGPHEDFLRYPRTLDADLEMAKECGVQAAFIPSAEDLYPSGYSTYVEETNLSQSLCGACRPGHFRGVTTVVLKLFNLVRPTNAYFGLKDAQQFLVLKKMAEDLNLDVNVVGVPTVREADGLALSSRNRYLSADERERASLLYRALQKARDAIAAGSDPRRACANEVATLEQNGFRVQYFEAWPANDKPTLIAAAAYLGNTRLIDNISIAKAAGSKAHDLRAQPHPRDLDR